MSSQLEIHLPDESRDLRHIQVKRCPICGTMPYLKRVCTRLQPQGDRWHYYMFHAASVIPKCELDTRTIFFSVKDCITNWNVLATLSEHSS